MERRTLILLFLWTIPLWGASELFSQEYQSQSFDRNTQSRYFLDTEDKLLQFPVNIIGLVNKPGQYMVPYQTNLITLIAMAGGFREDAKISRVKIIRNAASSSRYSSNARYATNGRYKRARVFSLDIKKYIEKGDQRQTPELKPDDTVIVTGSTTRTINKVFSFVSKGIMLAQLYFLIRVANDR